MIHRTPLRLFLAVSCEAADFPDDCFHITPRGIRWTSASTLFIGPVSSFRFTVFQQVLLQVYFTLGRNCWRISSYVPSTCIGLFPVMKGRFCGIIFRKAQSRRRCLDAEIRLD